MTSRSVLFIKNNVHRNSSISFSFSFCFFFFSGNLSVFEREFAVYGWFECMFSWIYAIARFSEIEIVKAIIIMNKIIICIVK